MPLYLPQAYCRFALYQLLLGIALTYCHAPSGLAQETDSDEVLAGHSAHGEAFNEGARQAAYLMEGLGDIQFDATTENPQAQQFINQGVAQLHGFWYYEAERSFRQAAVFDPECAIAYWGMAMANTGNMERARGFMEEAVARLDGVSRRERMYIKAYEKFCQEKDAKDKKIDKKDRAQRYTRDLEGIVEEFPSDIEAKAFLALQLWQNERSDLPIVSYVAVNSILQDVFDVNPMHPAHHYRIHLWDRHKAKRALESAALCGPSSPAIAHMWHMPGHIYDKLHRYHDAVWQQEASARTDHAHMMRDRVLPDQIHNFAHNNEWLIRNLVKIGRVNDALSLAKNMLELPRHPKYNTLEKRGSTRYGRERLLLVLESYRLWPTLIDLADTMYLEPTDDRARQVERLRYLGFALAMNGNTDRAKTILDELESDLARSSDEIEEFERQAEADKAQASENDQDSQKAAANRKRRKEDREKKLSDLKKLKPDLEKAIAAIQVALSASEEEFEAALARWKDAGIKDSLLRAEWMMSVGKNEEALKVVDKEIDSHPGQLLPLATKAFLLSQESASQAREVFEQVRILASQADLETPLLARLASLASELGFPEDWRAEYKPADDIGQRPDLDTLGPFRWHPYLAPDFEAEAVNGKQLALHHLKGKPSLVIFYLGFGCLHCVEQLHEFSPRAAEFREQGIEVVAISSEKMLSLKEALADYSNPLDIPLHTDPELLAFKSYRCFDDFEGQPLHGTFLIDPEGRVLWQDISYEPFMDVDFALKESLRLLKLSGHADSLEPIVHEKGGSLVKD